MSSRADRRAHRVPVAAEEPLIGDAQYGYADTFEIQVPETDPRSAEQFARCALEQAPWPIRWTVWTAHRHLLRLRQGPRSSPDHGAVAPPGPRMAAMSLWLAREWGLTNCARRSGRGRGQRPLRTDLRRRPRRVHLGLRA